MFLDAVFRWLEGDDTLSLPTLADLANADNRAAQIFLGAIHERGMATSPWVAALSADQRDRIFRRMDTAYGTPWLQVAASAGDRMAFLLGAWLPDDRGFLQFEHGLELAALGESELAVDYLISLLSVSRWHDVLKLEAVARDARSTPYLWAAAVELPAGEAEALKAEALQAIADGTMDGYWLIHISSWTVPPPIHVAPPLASLPDEVLAMARHVVDGPGFSADSDPMPADAVAFLDAWLAETPDAVLVRSWCDAACWNADTTACAREVYGLVGGRDGLARWTPGPLQTIVPRYIWLATPRALMTLDSAAVDHLGRDQADRNALQRLPLQQCVKDRLSQAY